jgi:hypothetical protein
MEIRLIGAPVVKVCGLAVTPVATTRERKPCS